MNNTLLLQSILVLFIFTNDYFSIQTTEAWHHQSFLPPASCFIPSSGGTSSSRRVSCPIRTKEQEHVNTAKTTTTTTRLYEKFYTKGAEIYPTCNNKQFTLADSFPNGTIPPRAQSILKEKNVDIPLASSSSSLSSDPMTLSVMSLSRRNFFFVGGAGISTTLVAMGIQNRRIDEGITGNAIMTATSMTTTTTMDVSQAIEWLDQYCDRRFLHAMVASDYRFLYYGIGNNSNAAGIRTVTLPPSDLLSVETYGTQKAVDYFQSLESKLEKELVKPSNGHLMTTSEKDAAEWGCSVASMWPMDGAHFAWFGDLKPFFDARHAGKDNRHEELIVDGKDCGRDGLEDALRGDHTEVLVNARQYLVVPVEFDEELRNALKSSFLV